MANGLVPLRSGSTPMAAFPIYNICNLHTEAGQQSNDVLIEDLGSYLDKHYTRLHFPHRHSFYHLVLFTRGQGTHTIDFKKFKVKAGQLYCMVPGQVHSWDFEGPMAGYILNFSENYFRSFLLDPHFLDRFSFFSGDSEEGVLQLPAAPLQQATGCLDDLVRTFQKTTGPAGDHIKVLLLRFLLLIEDAIGSPVRARVPHQKKLMLKTFRNLIEKNYRQLRLPNEYAALLYMTPHHLNALCQELSGRSAGEVIRDRILLEAKRLLVSHEMTAAQIALELNFKDASYFNRFFKKATGLTPFEFRKQIHSS